NNVTVRRVDNISREYDMVSTHRLCIDCTDGELLEPDDPVVDDGDNTAVAFGETLPKDLFLVLKTGELVDVCDGGESDRGAAAQHGRRHLRHAVQLEKTELPDVDRPQRNTPQQLLRKEKPWRVRESSDSRPRHARYSGWN